MEQNNVPSEENKTNENHPSDPIKPIVKVPITDKSSKATSSDGKQSNIEEKKKPKQNFWWKHNWLSFVLAIATVGTLISYIVVSFNQNSLTRIALIKADIANTT